MPALQLVTRGLLAAVAVAAAVAVGASGAPLAGGVASVFPAIFMTTMVSLWWAQGEAVPAGAVGPMMLGSSSVSVYALASIPLFVLWGPVVGAVCAWGVAGVCWSVPVWLWLERRHKRDMM